MNAEKATTKESGFTRKEVSDAADASAASSAKTKAAKPGVHISGESLDDLKPRLEAIKSHLDLGRLNIASSQLQYVIELVRDL